MRPIIQLSFALSCLLVLCNANQYENIVNEVSETFKNGLKTFAEKTPLSFISGMTLNLGPLENAVIDFESEMFRKVLSHAVLHLQKLAHTDILWRMQTLNNEDPNLVASLIDHIRKNDPNSYLINMLESMSKEEQEKLVLEMFSPTKIRALGPAIAAQLNMIISITSNLSGTRMIICYVYKKMRGKGSNELRTNFKTKNVSFKTLIQDLGNFVRKPFDFMCEVKERKDRIKDVSLSVIPVKSQQLCALKLVLEEKTNKKEILEFINKIPWHGNQEVIIQFINILNSNGKFQDLPGYSDACNGLEKHKDSVDANDYRELTSKTPGFDFKNTFYRQQLVEWIRDGIAKALSDADPFLEKLYCLL